MKKQYEKLYQLPNGKASDNIIKGCIVLEGGAFRGLYGEGVLDALMQEGVNMQCTIGVSAGAMNGLNYVSGQIGRSIRLNLKYRHDNRYVGRKALIRSNGIIGFDFAFYDVDKENPFDKKRFFDFNRRFVAVATNCESGETTYFEKGKCKDIFKAVQASATLPFVSKEVMIENTPYLDGGCSNKIPYEWALKEGYEKIIIVRTRPKNYRRKVESMNISIEKIVYQKYPNLVNVLVNSNERYNEQCDIIDQLEKEGKVFVIAPLQPVQISRLEKDIDKLASLYYQGYYETKKMMKDIKNYISK